MEPPALGGCGWVPRPLHVNTTTHGALLEWRSNQELHFSTALRPPQQNYLPSSRTINRKIKKSALDSLEKLLFLSNRKEAPTASCLWSSTRMLLGIFPSHLPESLPHPALTTSQGWKRLKPALTQMCHQKWQCREAATSLQHIQHSPKDLVARVPNIIRRNFKHCFGLRIQ